MKHLKRLLSCLMALAMLVSCVGFYASAKTAEEATYNVIFEFDVDNQRATASILVEGGVYGVGRVSFAYDAANLTLVDKDFEALGDTYKLTDVAVGFTAEQDEAVNITTTAETNAVADLLDTENGVVRFAWYASEATAFVDASEEAQPIARVNFAITGDLAALEGDFAAFSTVAKAVKETELIFAPDEEIPESLKGWGEAASVADNANVKSPAAVTTETVVSADMEDADAKVTKTKNSVTVTWKDEEPEGVESYNVILKEKKTGTLVGQRNVPANASQNGTFQEVFEDLNPNTPYEYEIIPITENGEEGVPYEGTVTTSSGGSSAGLISGGGGTIGTDTTYTVTFDAKDGTLVNGVASKQNITKGQSVKNVPQVNAPEGMVFAGWTVDGTTVVTVETYKVNANTTFSALYVAKEEAMHTAFIVGYDNGEVKPEENMTRAEAAAILARLYPDFSEEGAYTSASADVAATAWYAKYIGFIQAKGMDAGVEKFRPDEKITRAEFITFIRVFKSLVDDKDTSFSDVAKDYWAIGSIGACEDAGYVIGYEDGTFRPDNKITRAEAVTVLNRLTDREPDEELVNKYVDEKGIPFPDLKKDTWYFYQVIEAAYPHLIPLFH